MNITIQLVLSSQTKNFYLKFCPLICFINWPIIISISEALKLLGTHSHYNFTRLFKHMYKQRPGRILNLDIHHIMCTTINPFSLTKWAKVNSFLLFDHLSSAGLLHACQIVHLITRSHNAHQCHIYNKINWVI